MVEKDEPIQNKSESGLSNLDISEAAKEMVTELNDLFEKQQQMYGRRKELILELLEQLRHDGFKDHQIIPIMLQEVKGISRSTIYSALPEDVKRRYSKSLTKQVQKTYTPEIIDVSQEERKQGWEAPDDEAEMEELALKYSPSFKEEDVDMNTVQFTMNARDGREFFKKEMSEFVDKIGKRLPGLANRGWRWLNVEVTLKVKPK